MISWSRSKSWLGPPHHDDYNDDHYDDHNDRNDRDDEHDDHDDDQLMSFQSDRLYLATRCYATLFSEDTFPWEKVLISTQIDLSQPRCVFSLLTPPSILMPNNCYEHFWILQFLIHICTKVRGRVAKMCRLCQPVGANFRVKHANKK